MPLKSCRQSDKLSMIAGRLITNHARYHPFCNADDVMQYVLTKRMHASHICLKGALLDQARILSQAESKASQILIPFMTWYKENTNKGESDNFVKRTDE